MNKQHKYNPLLEIAVITFNFQSGASANSHSVMAAGRCSATTDCNVAILKNNKYKDVIFTF